MLGILCQALISPGEAARGMQCSMTEVMESAFLRENFWGSAKQ